MLGGQQWTADVVAVLSFAINDDDDDVKKTN